MRRHRRRIRRQKLRPQIRRQRIQERPQAGPARPLHRRILPAQRMQVDRLPDIQLRRNRPQHIPILPGLQDRRRPANFGQQRRPRPFRRHLMLQRPDRRRMHRRHLHRHHPARRQLPHQPRQQPRMPAQPMQRRVGIQHIHRRLGRPPAKIRLREPAPRRRHPRALQHRPGPIDPQHIRPSPTLFQNGRDIPRPTPQIDHPPRRSINPRQQIQRRPQPLIAIAQIHRRVPLHGDTLRHVLRHWPAPHRKSAPGPPRSNPDGSATP